MNSTELNRSHDELWKYIFSVFPLIDIPFGIICIVCSDNPLITLSLLPLFPIVATFFLKLSVRRKLEPGYWIFLVNGVVFVALSHWSGPNSPTWLMLINMTVGSSFMFNKPWVGRVILIVFVALASLLFYTSGMEALEVTIIFFSLIAFLVLFSRTYAYAEIQQQRIHQKNVEIESQKKELEMKNQDILSSISYARRIQYAVLPGEESIYRAIPLSFIVYRPKDIVSGDFFWLHEMDASRYLIACGDCTGHGVPGAMMTVVGSSALNHIVLENNVLQPSQILQELNHHISSTLRQQRDHEYFVNDGMDIAVVLVDKKEMKLTIASARRPIVHISNQHLTEIPANRVSLGGLNLGAKQFTDTEITFKTDDVLYLYTDGITDQFGGPELKKFSKKRLHQILFRLHGIKMQEQKQRLEKTINDWQGTQEQIDDILLIGIKF